MDKCLNFEQTVSLKTKSLDYWSRHDPLLMADEVYFETRGTWQRKTDFIISCVSYGIGIGNMWRFPYVCLRYGCGSFLVIYTFFVITIAIPLSLLETSLAQFANTGVIQCWSFCPGFKGIGYCMLIISLFCSFYYCLVLAWGLYYTLNSMRMKIPFLNCGHQWNDAKCVSLDSNLMASNKSSLETSAEQFWYRYVTTQLSFDGKSFNDLNKGPGKLIWYTTSCLVIIWLITAVVLMKGIRVSGKKVFVSVVLPYSVLFVFLVLAAKLPGSKQGLLLFFLPKLDILLKPSTWYAACEQIFFSFGVGFGGIITMGSFNRFHYNIQRDTIGICLINWFTSLLSGVIVFLILGYISFKYNMTMATIINKSHAGLIFMIFPECCSYYSNPQLTNTVYFITFVIMGFDSVLVMMETVVTGLVDILPALNRTQYHRICFIFLLLVCCTIFSLIFVTKTGFSWFVIFSKFGASGNVMVIGLTETVIVTYVYQLKNFYRDCRMMLPKSLFKIWKVCFLAIIPVVVIGCLSIRLTFMYHIVAGTVSLKLELPFWAKVLGCVIFVLTILPVPGFYVFYVYYNKRTKYVTWKDALKRSLNPDINWGPRKKRKWLLDEYYNSKLVMVKDMEEKLTKNRKSYNISRSEWHQRLNLLGDKLFIESEYADSRSKESDVNLNREPIVQNCSEEGLISDVIDKIFV